MENEGITVEQMGALGFVQTEEYASSSGSFVLWLHQSSGRRVWLMECGSAYFDVSRDGSSWEAAKRLRWPYTADDIARTMTELGWTAGVSTARPT